MQNNATQSILTASLSQRARILTLAIDASFIHGAVVINRTGAICAASNFRIPLKASSTPADVLRALGNTRSSFAATLCSTIRSHRRFLIVAFSARIAIWIVGWAVADGTSSLDTTQGMSSTTGICAWVYGGWCSAEAASDWVSDTSRCASAGEATDIVRANSVGTARVAQTFVDILFAFDLSVAKVTWRA